MTLNYIKDLDGLRAIAAFMVIFAHFFNSQNFHNYPLIYKIAGLGNSGVSLFFVLSGFVITRILLASLNSKTYFKSFYTRRILRIFPLYYFALLCYYYLPYLALNFNLHIGHQYPLGYTQVYFFTYLQNIATTFSWQSSGPSHFWSLAVEEHFYIIWPAIIYLFYKVSIHKLIYVIYVIIALPVIIRGFMLYHNYNVEYFTLTRMDQLAMGSLLAIFEKEGKLHKRYQKFYYLAFLSGISLFVCCFFANDFFRDSFKHTAMGIIYFSAIALVIINSPGSNFFSRFLNFRIVQYLGTISYGIYVWHLLILTTITRYYRTQWFLLDLLLGILITIFIASLSYYLLEKPFLKLKRFFPYR
ncbi:MAG: acyltransferase [Chitinophagaceae bacterium]|nr:acyltransferase [Chitinophagaceae bacterium]